MDTCITENSTRSVGHITNYSYICAVDSWAQFKIVSSAPLRTTITAQPINL